jgi:hypothetical protein
VTRNGVLGLVVVALFVAATVFLTLTDGHFGH